LVFFVSDQDLPSSHYLTPNDPQRLKHIRRIESAHVSSSSNTKTSKIFLIISKINIPSNPSDLITPDSWRTDPIITKKSSSISQQDKSSKQRTAAEIISKRVKTDIEESLGHNHQRTEKIIKPKRDTSLY
jgi:hypothetical protein